MNYKLLIGCLIALVLLIIIGVVLGMCLRKKSTSAGSGAYEAVLVHSKNCGYCVRMLPVWRGLKRAKPWRHINLREMCAETDMVPAKMAIRAFPTIIGMKKGRIAGKHEGAVMDQSQLKQMIEDMF